MVVLRSSLVVQWLRTWHCHCIGLGHCCVVGSVPGLRTSVCCWCDQKKKKKNRAEIWMEILGLQGSWNCSSTVQGCFSGAGFSLNNRSCQGRVLAGGHVCTCVWYGIVGVDCLYFLEPDGVLRALMEAKLCPSPCWVITGRSLSLVWTHLSS